MITAEIESSKRTATPAALRRSLDSLSGWSGDEFRSFEFAVVEQYRQRPCDQEWIEVELTRKLRATRSESERDRLDEILAMLDHVHDPLISATSLA
jgi:hypothetical protein